MLDFDKYIKQLKSYPLVHNLILDEVNHCWVVELTTGQEMQLQCMYNGKIKVVATMDDLCDTWLSTGDWLNDLTRTESLGE